MDMATTWQRHGDGMATAWQRHMQQTCPCINAEHYTISLRPRAARPSAAMVKVLALESPAHHRYRVGFSRKGGPKDGAVVVSRGAYPSAKPARAKLAQVAERLRPTT